MGRDVVLDSALCIQCRRSQVRVHESVGGHGRVMAELLDTPVLRRRKPRYDVVLLTGGCYPVTCAIIAASELYEDCSFATSSVTRGMEAR